MENKEITSIKYIEKTRCPSCGAKYNVRMQVDLLSDLTIDKQSIDVHICKHCHAKWLPKDIISVKTEESSNPLFNRILPASRINTITVCKDGMDANYYNIEEQFEIAKQLINPRISSLILLGRFIKGVINKEIEPFNLTVVDINGQEYQGYIDEYGNLEEVYAGSIIGSKIFKLNENLNIEIYKK